MANTISATELKNKISEILNNTYFKGRVSIIERYGKPIAKIVPVEAAPYRIFTNEEIKEWLKDDPLDPKLAGEINKKLGM